MMIELTRKRCAVPGCEAGPIGWLCGGCERRLAGVCYGKVRYRQIQATRLAREWRDYGGDLTRAYRCRVCSEWHLGRRSGNTAECEAEVGEMVRRLRAGGYGWLLGQLADRWHPERVDRVTWKARVTL